MLTDKLERAAIVAAHGNLGAATDEIRRLQHEGAKSADAARALLNA